MGNTANAARNRQQVLPKRALRSSTARVLIALGIAAAFLTLTLSESASAAEVFRFKEAFGSGAQPTFANPTSLAVDQASGDLLVVDKGDSTIKRFKLDGSPDNFSALGTNVISATPGGPLVFGAANETQIAVDNSGTATDGNIYVTQGSPPIVSIFASSGEFLGNLTATGSEPLGFACGVSVGPDGAVYIGDYERFEIQKFVPSSNPPTNSDAVASFPQERACQQSVGVAASLGSIFSATWNFTLEKRDAATGAVDYEIAPGGLTVTNAVAPESGDVLHAIGKEVTEYDASGPAPGIKVASLSVANNVQGIAVGPGGETYVSSEGQAGIEVWELVRTPSVVATAATDVSQTEATFNGTVNPETAQLTSCKFEYAPVTSGPFTLEAPCTPSAATIPPDETVHPVSANVTGLDPGVTYKIRLSATNLNGTSTSSQVTLNTTGQPLISEVRASFADQASVNLEATIDPHGFDTSYRFEWGATTAYAHSIPLGTAFTVAAGAGPAHARIPITGLAPGATYHYRVVANSDAGETKTTDQLFQTLNGCELPDQRCMELVSPREIGPVALPGYIAGGQEMDFQASRAPGALAYVVATGLPDATRGGQVLYLGKRDARAGGWISTQYSPPITARAEQLGANSNSSATQGISENLGCGFVESNQPLTSDPGTRLVVEAGGANLYRRNTDGTYTAVTNVPPQNPEVVGGEVGNEYDVVGFSQNCSKVVFTTAFGIRYPGISGIGQKLIYEWADGTLRSVSTVPGPSGEEVLVEAFPGAFPGPKTENKNHSNAVSADGSRVFFSAARETSLNPKEVGAMGVFVRENGTVTRDLSLSETGTADEGAIFQYATRDGSKVFFTANAGLTAESNIEGTDLYEYDLETENLADLSISDEPGAAAVIGFVGASGDGSRVYFVARGQLVTGEGSTFAENVADQTYSIYSAKGGVVSYVGIVNETEIEKDNGFTVSEENSNRTTQVSADGRYLLFQTSANVTGYSSGGNAEAYLYDAAAESPATICVSCRQDGLPSTTVATSGPLRNFATSTNPLHRYTRLAMRGGQPMVFFASFDQLAAGAKEGVNNIYQWSHGQIFRIATEPSGIASQSPTLQELNILFADASEDGTDLYFTTPVSLTWEDSDGGRQSVYDARIGGGFPEPPAATPPCSPAVEGSCSGPSVAPPGAPSAGTASFTGPGNAKHKKQKHKKQKHKKQKHKKQKHKKQKHKKSGRAANGHRGAGK